MKIARLAHSHAFSTWHGTGEGQLEGRRAKSKLGQSDARRQSTRSRLSIQWSVLRYAESAARSTVIACPIRWNNPCPFCCA